MENGNGKARLRTVTDSSISCASLLAKDWAASSIGDQKQWPSCIKETISFLIHSPFPMHVAWGPQLQTIYNDAYARILDDLHPAAFGAPLLSIWKDGADHLSPLLQKLLTGESLDLENHLAKLHRHRLGARCFSASHMPLRDGSGVPIAVWSTLYETTPTAEVATRVRARLDLLNALSNISSFDEAIRIASDVLAAGLDASRILLLQWEPAQLVVEVRSIYARPGHLILKGDYEASMFGARFFNEIDAGRSWNMDNRSMSKAAEERSAANIFHSLAIRSALALPVNRLSGRKHALLVTSDTPRQWEGDDTAFAREIVDRTLLAVEEMQIRQAAERERKHLLQDVVAMREEKEYFFDVADELLAVLDHRGLILRINPVWERVLGHRLAEMTGKALSDFVPASAHARFTKYFRAAASAGRNTVGRFPVITRTDSLLDIEWKICTGHSAIFFYGKADAPAITQDADITGNENADDGLLHAGTETFDIALMNEASVIVAVVDATTSRFIYANKACAALIGDSALVGKPVAEALPPPQAGRFVQAFTDVRQSGQSLTRREIHLPLCADTNPDGTEKYIDFEFQPWREADNSITAFIIVGHDATAEVIATNDACIASERWRLAVESKGSGVWEHVLQTGSVTFSPQWLRMLGYGTQDFEATFESFQALVHPQDRARITRAVKACIAGSAARIAVEYRIRGRSGIYQWVESRGMVVARDAHGIPTRLSGILTDISKKKQTAETQWTQANFDTLTGLPNRRLFMNRLDSAVLKSARSGRALALLFIDLDRFKSANDSFGHDVGDRILSEAAARINSCVRTCDTVARLGGDEFTVMMSDLPVPAHIEIAAQKIIDIVALPFTVNGDVIQLSASIGITLYSQDATSSSELISNADRAMYVAKSRGGNQFCYFTNALQLAARHRMQLTSDLRDALKNNEFDLVFQPVFKLATMEIVRAEVLLRWDHPRLGIMQPADFLSVAQESHQIDVIDDWVFCQTAQLADRIKKETGRIFPFCVKKTLPQMQTSGQPFGWLEKIRELELSPGTLTVEIGEDFMHGSKPAVLSLLNIYRNAGVGLVLNNFGAGSFSVAQICQREFQFLKVHVSQIKDLTRSKCHSTVLATVLKIGDCLGVEVIISDIETEQQKECLQTIGYAYGLGFHLSRPVSEATLLYKLGMR